METLTINGGKRLYGELSVCGSKNAILPVLAACILTDEEVTIHNAPEISDIDDMLFIMNDLGIKSNRSGKTLSVNASGLNKCEISDEHVGKIRSSVILLGAVIARTGMAKLARPGGCDIGARPIDMHLSAFEKLGVNISYDNDVWYCKADKLKGTEIVLPFPSVGATENIILAAAMADGTTVIRNAAREPEIKALEDFIDLMGGEVSGAGTSTITVTGKKHYHACDYTVISDRIVAGTYMLMTAATGGDVNLTDVQPEDNRALIDCLSSSNVEIKVSDTQIRVRRTKKLKAVDLVETAPFPGFPTDLQPQLMAAMTVAEGTSVIRETIYENRFRAALALCQLGADIHIRINDDHNNIALVRGVSGLCGAEIYGTDLRCNAALVTAGLVAEGTTIIRNAHFIRRGYENIVEAVRSIGGDIT